MSENAFKKKPGEGILPREEINASYKRTEAEQIFTKFLDDAESTRLYMLRSNVKPSKEIQEKWLDLIKKVDTLLQDPELNSLFTAHMIKSIEASMNENPPNNETVLQIMNKVGETRTYLHETDKLRQEDNSHLREVIVNVMRYNIDNSPNRKWKAFNTEEAMQLMNEFVVQSTQSAELEKTVRTGFFRHKHTEKVNETQDLSIEQRMKKFKNGEF
jgi:hypothetical protein